MAFTKKKKKLTLKEQLIGLLTRIEGINKHDDIAKLHMQSYFDYDEVELNLNIRVGTGLKFDETGINICASDVNDARCGIECELTVVPGLFPSTGSFGGQVHPWDYADQWDTATTEIGWFSSNKDYDYDASNHSLMNERMDTRENFRFLINRGINRLMRRRLPFWRALGI